MAYVPDERVWGVKATLKDIVRSVLRHCRSRPGGPERLANKNLRKLLRKSKDASTLYTAYKLVDSAYALYRQYETEENEENLEEAKQALIEVHEELGLGGVKDAWVSKPHPHVIVVEEEE